mmetsp:Transcript_3391/g.6270  ORF Transcript_3391/g.6270 Transcript_3391/m.6270 type:complete len:294 (-) Transcript_3391:351-1232(-)
MVYSTKLVSACLLLFGPIMLLQQNDTNEHFALAFLSGLPTNHKSRTIVIRSMINDDEGNCAPNHSKEKDSPPPVGEHPDPDTSNNPDRRAFFGALAASTASAVVSPTRASAAAANPKSRVDGYAVHHTEREWAYLLSGPQYNILRRGGTERQKSSILNTFTSSDRGTYVCAGCATPLFASDAKFSSGTGWPSFATALEGVEVEDLDPIRATLDGREVRCGTCGGHLGDVFNDGWIYVNTAAFASGKRYCIDGASLIFKPEGTRGNGEVEDVYGDQPPPNKMIRYEQSMYRNAA